jgi:predicted Zn-dependent protease with MMP-like domain
VRALQINDYYMASASLVSQAHVLCQEVGHTFGLGHQSESGDDLNTCMDYA